jgi:hypothetical protein
MRRIIHTLVAVAAASALAASTAAAKPIDRVDRFDSPTSSLAGTVEHQDLRGEHAQDAARLAAQAQIDRGEQTRKAYFLRRQAPHQDLRGEAAQEAARLHVAPSKGPAPVYWSYAYEAPKPDVATASAPAPKPSDDTDLWLILGIALGATGIVAGSAVAVGHRSRSRVPA